MGSSASRDLTAEDLLEMYRLMLQGRRFSQRALDLHAEGRLPIGLHPSAGQEAVGVGVCFGLRSSDWLIPSLRTTEAYWTRGVTILQMFDAILGNSGSISKGKESFHHCGYPELGILAGSSIVGAQIPVAVGAAVALRMKQTDDVMVCFFGDGAAARGDFHEGLNLAAVLKAPVVFVCENNLHFQSAPASVGMAIEDIADRAVGYGFPGHIVDGQDVLAVYDVAHAAIERARAGEGPTLIECKTYRFQRHYATMREVRDPEEVEAWRRKDPIDRLAKKLRDEGHTEDRVLTDLELAIDRELGESFAAAEATPPPDAADALSQVYAEPIEAIGP